MFDKDCCEDGCHYRACCWKCRRCDEHCPRLKAGRKPRPCDSIKS